ncbi:DUF3305 domain-containing protein [Nitrincola sp.]|uniref:DUF3305 domain-containing protein n=1 Tax=Nitrincola sp. TaxID=1926584 RepID=UPI003A90A70A
MAQSDHGPTSDKWPLWVVLDRQETQSRGWPSVSWKISQISAVKPEEPEAFQLCLQLHRDERMAYRFNLSAQAPTLFVICEEVEAGKLEPRKLSVAQDLAADHLDAGQPVLSIPMPQAIYVWLEQFMAKHGELEDPKAGKRRLRAQAAGEASGGAA